MKNFVDTLEDQLLQASRAQTASPHRNRRESPRWRAAGALGTVVAVAGVVIAVQAGSNPDQAYALPILKGPTVNASHVSIAPALRRAGADLDHARSFATSVGTAYAVPTDDGLCIATPDPAGGYGQACATTAEIQRRGLPSALAPSDPSSGPTQFTVVLPKNATAPTLQTPGSASRTLEVKDGVASTTVTTDSTVSYDIAGHVEKIAVPATAPKLDKQLADCDGPTGHYLVVGGDGDTERCPTP